MCGVVDFDDPQSIERVARNRSDCFTVTPCRVVDTRNAGGPYGGPALSAGSDRTFVLAGPCDIPASATAVALNVVVVAPTGSGHLTLFPEGTTLPPISTLNYNGGTIRANWALVSLGAGGDLRVHCAQGAGTANLVIDVTGYFE